jgi:nuclear pore complex protein Nup85
VGFIDRYRDFHRVYDDKEYRAAAEMLCLLLTSDVAPKRFWMKLLFDALPLLEGEKVWFGLDETYELMRCLEETCVGGEGEGVVRMALTRNLSRAIFTRV